ncbi:thiamine pyrophosphate-dependent enzyme [Sediminibacillus massiliensis]|uniref:thiamine pyrophosphate-dependent enzyme n=1 Tax=Sediminibacillus massiliensis TaxID=1926277 RepID=UPI000988804D|nr:thiamine pyrophosphate-dependent enzyme [Sediminibacillus massiliensis]
MTSGAVPYLTSAKAIVECMKLEGVSHVFCVPGESYLPVMDAIYDEPAISLIAARHEGGAAFMAEGYAKASGKPGVVMATRGVGGSNLSIGVHTACQDSTPLVVFLGQVHSGFRGREGFQEVDLDNFFGPISKWAVEIKDAARVPELVQRAFRIAKTGRPGPVVISLPEDLLEKKARMEYGKPIVRPSPSPGPAELAAIDQLLRTANRPLLIAGGGVKSADGEQALIHFAEKFDIPVMAAFRRHDVFPNHHPLYVGHLGLGMDKSLLESVRKADTILAVGTRLSEVTTQDYSIISNNQKLIHIDIDADTLGKVYPPDVGVVADAKEALEKLAGLERSKSWYGWFIERRQAYVDSLQADKHTVNHAIVSILQEQLPPETVITNDAGNFAGWLHVFYQFKQKKTYIGPTSGAMGYGLPSALGAKLAEPGRPVVSLSGDGGFMMTMQELETAVRYKIPVVSIVFNNRMYGTIRMHQELHYPNRKIGTDLGDVPFADIAEKIGAVGFSVKTPEAFKQVLIKALKSNGPVVIEVETDPDQISVFHSIHKISGRA